MTEKRHQAGYCQWARLQSLVCVSLSQRELDYQLRDRRTTELCERDVSAARTAHAAGIRLCMKTVVERPVGSAQLARQFAQCRM
jgi:hypothetical protein